MDFSTGAIYLSYDITAATVSSAFGGVGVAGLAGCSGSDDGFGLPVESSADGSTALVGALDDEDPNGDFAGSAYVFDTNVE